MERTVYFSNIRDLLFSLRYGFISLCLYECHSSR